MPTTNFDLVASGEIIPAQTDKRIRILLIWFELETGWVAGTIFGFNWNGSGEIMFRKSMSGVASINLVGKSINEGGIVGAKDTALDGSMSVAGKHVRGTIIWEAIRV